MEWTKDQFTISDERSRLDLDMVCRLLWETYWAADRPRETIEKSIEHSVSFGLYTDGRQIGYARVITDTVVFSWLLDFVIDVPYRGHGLGQWLLDCILNHPDIRETNMSLATKDAHTFYEKYGFKPNETMKRMSTFKKAVTS
ncbi:GNAT family N-acetyltransferase [Siminovitchia sediminis]|uniref:GNAT family N-acetyltransferase n=1 Tax=Siminovitchia sediminis TaxID=1274353 RepID=A0ABW4KEU8_9BACI